MKDILLAFIPIFVAVDAIGVLPVFVSFTEGLAKKEKSKIILESIFTALCLAIGFIILGKAIFKILGITIGDFMIAGGVILFSIAITDMLSTEKHRRIPQHELGAVPLGTPLIAGPAVFTTSLIIIDEYGLLSSLISILINIFLAGLIFLHSDFLIKTLGKTGTRVLSKITSLFLAAIAVMLIRKGIIYTFKL